MSDVTAKPGFVIQETQTQQEGAQSEGEGKRDIQREKEIPNLSVALALRPMTDLWFYSQCKRACSVPDTGSVTTACENQNSKPTPYRASLGSYSFIPKLVDIENICAPQCHQSWP